MFRQKLRSRSPQLGMKTVSFPRHFIENIEMPTNSECRNVLIRYCSHIPRNYQYRDGIPKVFLILREHMGDENLDLAGGVLYELIEVDCAHTDDPGASFQRWRFHHMQRHVGPLFILVARHIRRKLTIFEHFLD